MKQFLSSYGKYLCMEVKHRLKKDRLKHLRYGTIYRRMLKVSWIYKVANKKILQCNELEEFIAMIRWKGEGKRGQERKRERIPGL